MPRARTEASASVVWTTAVAVCAVLGLAVPCGPAAAQPLRQQRVFRLSTAAAEVGVQMDGDRASYADTGGPPGVRQMSYRQWVRLPFHGALFRPGLLSYTLALRPQIAQQSMSALPRGYLSRYMGFDVGVSAFDALPVGLTFNASRVASSMVGGAGTEGHFGTFTSTGTLRIQGRPFPMQLRYGSRYTNDLWQGGPTVPETRRHEQLRSFDFSGQSSKMALMMSRITFDDRIGALSFSSLDGDLTHTRRWGRGSSLQSLVTLGRREGNTPYRRASWTERVQLRHSDAASSDVYVTRRQSVTDGFRSGGYAVGGGTRYRAARWLTAGVTGARQASRYTQGDLSVTSVLPRLSYSFALPLRGQLAGGASLTLERERRSFGDEAWLPVLDEIHRTEAGPRGVTLLLRDVDTASVSVRHADRTFAYVRGIDYLIVVEGREARVVIVPGARITAGDQVLVSYRHRLMSGVDQRALGEALDVALTFGGISLRHAESARHVRSSDVRSVARGTGRDRVTTLGLRRETRVGAMDLQLERRSRSQAAGRYVTEEARVALLPPAGPALQTSFGATASRSWSEGRPGSAASTRGTANWTGPRSLRVQATLEGWLWRYAELPADRILGGNVEVDWRFGRIETEWRYAYQQRTTVQTSMQHRVSARVIRRF